jgi:hypothetical protein
MYSYRWAFNNLSNVREELESQPWLGLKAVNCSSLPFAASLHLTAGKDQ